MCHNKGAGDRELYAADDGELPACYLPATSPSPVLYCPPDHCELPPYDLRIAKQTHKGGSTGRRGYRRGRDVEESLASFSPRLQKINNNIYYMEAYTKHLKI